MDWENYVVKINVNSVNIDLNKPLDTSDIVQSSGSGFFICDDLILTCYHVIKYAVYIEIIYNQTITLLGEILYIFPDDDLAIIRINKTFPSIKILDYKEITNKKSLIVYSIGYPLSNNNIIETKGIISGYRKSLLQTDAALNPGNSGGPLVFFDENIKKWTVIAINVSKFMGRAEKTGFAVPIYRFNKLKNYIIENYKNYSFPSAINRPSWNFDYQLLKQDSLRNFLFKDNNKLTNNKIGIRVSELNKNDYLTKYFNVDDILLAINNNYIDINGFIKFDFFPEKISITEINLWFTINDIIKIKYYNIQSNIIKDIELKLKYIENNIIPFYNLKNKSYFIENNNLIFSIFTIEHYKELEQGNLNLTYDQTLHLLNRKLYRKDLFTVYLSALHPRIYNNNTKFIKYPIGDVIIEINNSKFDNYDNFINIMKKPVKLIKTIENKIFFVD